MKKNIFIFNKFYLFVFFIISNFIFDNFNYINNFQKIDLYKIQAYKLLEKYIDLKKFYYLIDNYDFCEDSYKSIINLEEKKLDINKLNLLLQRHWYQSLERSDILKDKIKLKNIFDINNIFNIAKEVFLIPEYNQILNMSENNIFENIIITGATFKAMLKYSFFLKEFLDKLDKNKKPRVIFLVGHREAKETKEEIRELLFLNGLDISLNDINKYEISTEAGQAALIKDKLFIDAEICNEPKENLGRGIKRSTTNSTLEYFLNKQLNKNIFPNSILISGGQYIPYIQSAFDLFILKNCLKKDKVLVFGYDYKNLLIKDDDLIKFELSKIFSNLSQIVYNVNKMIEISSDK
jgi:hypothetical protein